jgi:acyl-[acyl carrier protein]--UDP-N-acetylglucosamine O-acyltransferase
MTACFIGSGAFLAVSAALGQDISPLFLHIAQPSHQNRNLAAGTNTAGLQGPDGIIQVR